jgi:transmembrane sensor
MKEEKLWQLVSLRLSKEASPEELAELSLFEKENPEFRFRVHILEQLWRSKQESSSTSDAAFDKHLQRLSNHLASPALLYEEAPESAPAISNKNFFLLRKIKQVTAIAASIVIAASIFILFNNKNPASKRPQNIVATKPGSKSKIVLPDGTQVWLNSESNLVYNDKFGEGTREVELSGEAFFDVVKNVAKPFIIHTKTMDVKVLGTAFNVRSYPGEKTAETSLIRGLIEVTLRNNPDKKIILKPNEKLVVQNAIKKNEPLTEVPDDDHPLLILSRLHYFKGDSSAIETSWVTNKLAFEGESLSDVSAKIERWYGVRITINDERLKEAKYTGVFEDESLQEVMDALQLTGNFHYKIYKKTVVIDR